jgi:hypothetical protein
MIALMAIASVPLPAHAARQFVFGAMPDGQVVKQYQLTNKRGSKAWVITLGAALAFRLATACSLKLAAFGCMAASIPVNQHRKEGLGIRGRPCICYCTKK